MSQSVVVWRRIVNASERRWFESVDFGASALEEEEDYRSVAKANELMGVRFPVLLTLSMGLWGSDSAQVYFVEQPVILPHGTIV